MEAEEKEGASGCNEICQLNSGLKEALRELMRKVVPTSLNIHLVEWY